MIVATGMRETEPVSQYGYGKSGKVVTQRQLEKMLVENSLGSVKDVVIINCVCSRDSEHGCCNIGCMTAVKNARIIKERNPDANVYILYRDLILKGLEPVRERIRSSKGRVRKLGADHLVYSLVDAIVDGTETGSSLRANRLRVIATMFESTPRLIANQTAWEDPWKRDKTHNLLMLLKGALVAEAKVGLKMNVPRARLAEVIGKLPALHTPTISNQLDADWVALEVITDENVVRELIPQLKKSGAEGIIEYPLNKLVY
jgi:ATP phosphoribosyltransferase-like protein